MSNLQYWSLAAKVLQIWRCNWFFLCNMGLIILVGLVGTSNYQNQCSCGIPNRWFKTSFVFTTFWIGRWSSSLVQSYHVIGLNKRTTLWIKWTTTQGEMSQNNWYNIKCGFAQTGKESVKEKKIGWHPSQKMEFYFKFT